MFLICVGYLVLQNGELKDVLKDKDVIGIQSLCDISRKHGVNVDTAHLFLNLLHANNAPSNLTSLVAELFALFKRTGNAILDVIISISSWIFSVRFAFIKKYGQFLFPVQFPFSQKFSAFKHDS